MNRNHLLPAVVAFLLLGAGFAARGEEWKPIPRKLPPAGIAVPPADRERLEAGVAKLAGRLKTLPPAGEGDDLAADVAVYEKAVRFALLHGEFYKEGDFKAADALLATADKRLDALARGEHPWAEAHGLVVRGYRSAVDDSAQPYGLEIPADLDLSRPAPLYVWLHGRGDTATDLHFIRERESKKGQIAPKGAVVLHVFGRQCLGYKSTGEVDIFEAVASVERRYKIDPDRIVLAGFSMGGAGAWHVGAHYADQFAAVHTGAGFVDVARYQKLTPDKYPPRYEVALWGVYDVPDYVRNLFNVPVVAYSGEIDPQRAAAEIMAGAFKAEGRELTHLIGPGKAHQYDAQVLADVMRRLAAAAEKGRDRFPKQLSLQTRTLRYNHMHWATLTALGRHWADARLDADAATDGRIVVTTKNVEGFSLTSPWPAAAGADGRVEVRVDGTPLAVEGKDFAGGGAGFVKTPGGWALASAATPEPAGALRKRPSLQGPIDDVFMAPFLVVMPTGRCASDAVQKWVEFELKHFQDRWRAVYRGDLRTKKDADVTADDIARYHLILWGDAQSNALIARAAAKLPIQSAAGALTAGGQKFDAATHVPLLIYPNPLNPAKYVVLNSGPTHREDHDRTNSLQNPKLPDWAVIDVTTPPTGASPGRVAGAGFFDERWQFRAE